MSPSAEKSLPLNPAKNLRETRLNEIRLDVRLYLFKSIIISDWPAGLNILCPSHGAPGNGPEIIEEFKHLNPVTQGILVFTGG